MLIMHFIFALHACRDRRCQKVHMHARMHALEAVVIAPHMKLASPCSTFCVDFQGLHHVNQIRKS